MTMTEKTVQDHGLEALFEAAAQDAAQSPSPDLMARVLADAEAMQPRAAAPVVRAGRRGGVLNRVVAALGGWPSVGGLAAATVAGIWIGFSATPTVLPEGLAGFMGESSNDYLAYLDTSYAYLEEDAQ